MKNSTNFLLGLLFFCVSGLSAQEVLFGIKGGANYSSIVGDFTEGVKFRFSGHAGVFITTEFDDKFSLQGELLYSSQGFQLSSDLLAIENNGGTNDENDFRNNVQLNFLTVPILGRFALNDRTAVEFGPQFGFLLNQVSKTKILDEIDGGVTDSRTVIAGDFQLDYGVVAGLDFKVTDALSLAPRFYIGLKNNLSALGGQLQNYNVAIQVSANYRFF